MIEFYDLTYVQNNVEVEEHLSKGLGRRESRERPIHFSLGVGIFLIFLALDANSR